MALNLLKFQELPFMQRRKKLCYYIHRSLSEQTDTYLEDIQAMVDFINKSEYRQLQFENNTEGLKTFYRLIQAEILENDPFQESILFDEISKKRQLLPITVGIILENLRSPFNVGAFFRMAEAFGIHEIIIIGATPSPEKQNKVRKTAKGDLISFRIYENIEKFIDQNKKPDTVLNLYAIEKAKGSVNLNTLKFNKNEKQAHYFIFGNEEFGVSPSTLALCKNIFHIPMFGTKNSLNVSVAGGIVLNHLAEYLFIN